MWHGVEEKTEKTTKAANKAKGKGKGKGKATVSDSESGSDDGMGKRSGANRVHVNKYCGADVIHTIAFIRALQKRLSRSKTRPSY